MKSHVFDINYELTAIENIILRYQAPLDGTYVKTSRYPIGDRSVIEDSATTSKPSLPLYSALIIRDFVYLHIVASSPSGALWERNPLVPGLRSPIYDVDQHDSRHGILLDWLPTISDIDMVALMDLAEPIVCRLVDILDESQDYIYDIDLESRFVVVIKGRTLQDLRLTEALAALGEPQQE